MTSAERVLIGVHFALVTCLLGVAGWYFVQQAVQLTTTPVNALSTLVVVLASALGLWTASGVYQWALTGRRLDAGLADVGVLVLGGYGLIAIVFVHNLMLPLILGLAGAGLALIAIVPPSPRTLREGPEKRVRAITLVAGAVAVVAGTAAAILSMAG